MKKLLKCAVFLLLLLSLQSVKATVHIVSVGSFFFSPPAVTVNPGDTVRWVLSTGLHTTTSSFGSTKTWDSGLLGGAGFSLQFVLADGPGPFPYECAVHPFSMTGSVSVDMPPLAPPILFPFLLDEYEEALCVGTGSTATGYGLAILSSDSTNLSLFVVHNVSAPTAAHIHKAAICTDGSPVFPFASPASPISQGFAVTPADVADLFAGLFYVNIHSGTFPNGEIRGQIIPEPIRFIFALNEAQEVPPTASFASGCAIVVLNADGTELGIDIEHDVASITGGHIHQAPPGVSGGIVFPFSSAASPISQVWMLDTTNIKSLFLGNLYANVHSSAFSAGEIRGQVKRDSVIFTSLLDGAQANGGLGTGSAAKGFGVYVLSADQKQLGIYVEHNVVSPTNGHIHYGVPAVEGPPAFPFSSFTSPIIETWNLDPDDVDSLLNNGLYVNLHTAAFPSGEIRGQLEKEPITSPITMNDNQENLCAGNGSTKVGAGQTTLRPFGKELTLSATHNVVGPTGAHIHQAPACVDGSIVFPIPSPTSPMKGIWYLSSADVIDYLRKELYLNLHSTPFPSGEIRGQFEFVNCCLGGRGDVNSDGNNSTILDLNFLVNKIFRSGPLPQCAQEADCNSDGNSATILDLNFLVNKIFRAGPLPGPCPA